MFKLKQIFSETVRRMIPKKSVPAVRTDTSAARQKRWFDFLNIHPGGRDWTI